MLLENKYDKKIHITLPKKKRPDMYIPSDNDVKRLIDASKGTDLEIPILLAAFGPIRRGEICALDSSHIKGNVVHVQLNMVRISDCEWIIKSPYRHSMNSEQKRINGIINEHFTDVCNTKCNTKK